MKGSPAEDVPLAPTDKCFLSLTAWESLHWLWAHLSASFVDFCCKMLIILQVDAVSAKKREVSDIQMLSICNFEVEFLFQKTPAFFS